MLPDSYGSALGVVLVLGLIGVYLAWTAGRVDRMHGRVDAARGALDAALQRRSAVALEIATAGLLDPASAVLVADSAHRARAAPAGTEEQAESDLSRALAASFAVPEDAPPDDFGLAGSSFVARRPPGDAGKSLLSELADAAHRVQLARRFYNDAVRAARALRRHRLVRWFRLAGHTPLPRPIDFDDTEPPGLRG